MKITVTASMMKELFIKANRDYYTYEACEVLLDYYNEWGNGLPGGEMEFDSAYICGDCTEYGDNTHNFTINWDSLILEYDYLYSTEEWLEDNGLTEEEFDKDLFVDALIEKIEQKTTVLKVPNGNYIIFNY